MSELTECKDCGAAVLDRRQHRQWHKIVVTTNKVSTSPRYLGEEIGDIADSYAD